MRPLNIIGRELPLSSVALPAKLLLGCRVRLRSPPPLSQTRRREQQCFSSRVGLTVYTQAKLLKERDQVPIQEISALGDALIATASIAIDHVKGERPSLHMLEPRK